MESRWYIPPGKSKKTTKIKDRKHELHVSKENWEKITAHLDRNRLRQEALDAEEEKKELMRRTAEAMTKDWADCLKNIKDKELPNNDDKIAKGYELYKTLRKEQDDERKIYVTEMKKRMSRMVGYPRVLNSALLLSEVVYERDKQIELRNKINQHEKDEERKWAQLVIQRASEEIKAYDEKEAKKLMKKKAYSNELKNTFEANEREKKEEYRKRMEQESLENDMAKKEENLLKENQHKKMLQRKQQRLEDLQQQRKEHEEHENLKKKEEEDMEAFTKVIQEYKDKIQQITAQKKYEARKKRISLTDEAGEKLRKYHSDLMHVENERLKRDIAAKEAEFDRRDKSDMEKRRMVKEMLVGARKDYIDNLKREEYENSEMVKWQMLNNAKCREETKKFEEDLKQQKDDKAMKQKQGWDVDMEYKKKMKEINDEEERKALQEEVDALKREDDHFYNYAKEVTEFAKSRGRITYPLDAVVNNHKCNISKIETRKKQCTHTSRNELINKTPGKMAHDPGTDPNYAKTQCKCCCHKDVLYK